MIGRLCLAVDPGLRGAVVSLFLGHGDEEPTYVYCHPVPVLEAEQGKPHYDERRCAAILRELMGTQPFQPSLSCVVAVEDLGSVGGALGAGAGTAYRQGYGVGLWFGIAAAMGLPFVRVKPQQWQTTQLLGLPRRPGQVKQSAMRRALELWPDLPVRPKSTGQGVADAALLARHVLLGQRSLQAFASTPPTGERTA